MGRKQQFNLVNRDQVPIADLRRLLHNQISHHGNRTNPWTLIISSTDETLSLQNLAF